MVTVLSRGYGLIALAAAVLLSSTLEYVSASICAKKLFHHLSPRRRYLGRTECRELFGFGIYRFIWIVANQLIFYTDSVVIGLFVNAAAITYYAIAGSLINYGRNVVSLAADTFYPGATRLDAKQDTKGLQDLYILGTRITLIIGLPLCVGFLLLGKQFIGLWMGPAYAVSALYLSILTIPQFASMAQYISAVVLVAMAKHRVLAYLTLAEGVTNLALSMYLVRKMGVVGVAWGTVIPHAITTTLVVPLYTMRALNMKWRDYLLGGFLPAVAAAIPGAAVCYAVSVLIRASSWPGFVLAVFAVATATAVTSFFGCLSAAQRAIILNRFRRQPQTVAKVTI